MEDKSSARRSLNERLSLYLTNAALWLMLAGTLGLILRRWLLPEEHEPRILQYLSDELGFALVIAGLLIFTVEQRSRKEIDSTFKIHIEKVTDVIRAGISDYAGTVKLGNLPVTISHPSATQIVKDLGAELVSIYVGGMKIAEGGAGFEIEDRNWAILSTERLYRKLAASDLNGAEVRITHTGDPKTWDDSADVRASLHEQSRLVRGEGDRKNTIVRVFVGREAVPLDDGSLYLKAMRLMATHGIDARYVFDPKSRCPDMTWIPKLGFVMLWEEAKGRVSSIKVVSDGSRAEYLAREWEKLIREADTHGQKI